MVALTWMGESGMRSVWALLAAVLVSRASVTPPGDGQDGTSL